MIEISFKRYCPRWNLSTRHIRADGRSSWSQYLTSCQPNVGMHKGEYRMLGQSILKERRQSRLRRLCALMVTVVDQDLRGPDIRACSSILTLGLC